MSPLLGYTRNVYQGPGTTTYHLGQNEYLLNEQVLSIDQLYRVGLVFQCDGVQAGFTQGWRMYDWKDVTALSPGAGSGNVTTPVLGETQNADAIVGTQNNKINTPVTNAWVTANLFGRLKVIGNYVKADGSNETNYVEADAGKFVSFEIARFFAGLGETVNSRSRTDYWRASARAELMLAPNVDLAGGWVENKRVLDGQALISTLFLDTVTYAGQSTGDLLREINARTAVDDMTRVYDARVTARSLGPFSVNAGWSQTQQSVTATPDAEEIVVPGGQGGRFDRRVNTYGGGASFSQWGLTLTADYHHDSADAPIFRTDYLDRDRYNVRGVWNFKNFLKVGAFFRETHASDDIVQIGYNTKVREFQGDIEVTLFKDMLTLRGAGGEFLTNRQILDPGPAGLRHRPHRAAGVRAQLGGRRPLRLGTVLPRRGVPLDEQQRLHPLHGRPRPRPRGVLLPEEPRPRLRVARRQVQGAHRLRPGRAARELQRQPLLRRAPLAPVAGIIFRTRGGRSMKLRGSRLAAMVTGLVWCGWIAFSATSSATLDIQKQAKAAGVDAKTCQYCHVDKIPKKEAGQHDHNDVGKWLVAQKEKRGAKAVDGAWLKDYPGDKK